MFCSKCGHEIKDGGQVCPNCGAKGDSVVRSIFQGADKDSSDKKSSNKGQTSAKSKKKKPRKKSVKTAGLFKKLIGIFANLSTVYKVVCLAIIAVVCMTVYSLFGRLFLRNNSKKITFAAQASLEKVLKIKELHTVEYVYNSYAVAYEKPYYDMEVYDRLKPHYDLYLSLKKDLEAKKLDFKLFTKYFIKLCDGYESADSFLNDTHEDDAEILQWFGFESRKDFFDKYAAGNFDRLKSYVIVSKSIRNMCENESDLKDLIDFLAVNNEKAASDKSLKKVLYAVAYEGKVIAGIKDDIKFSSDDKNRKVTVHVPPVCIIDLNVKLVGGDNNIITLKKESVKQIDWQKKALQLCRADLSKKVDGNNEFMNVARENALDAVKALIRPFEQVSGYTFEIVED